MQWPDNAVATLETAARQELDFVCSACGWQGRWHRCSRCLSARYCSTGCQSAHWPAHREHCRRRRDVGGEALAPRPPAGGSDTGMAPPPAGPLTGS